MGNVTISVEVSEKNAAYLRVLTGANPHRRFKDLSAVLAYLASSVADGMRRPGAWERDVVLKLFGSDFEEQLERDPENPYNLKPKA